MKALQLTTNDLQGGAHRAAFRLHLALGQQGVDSAMAVLHKSGDDPRVRQLQPFPALPAVAGHFLFRLCRRLEHPVTCRDGALFSSERTRYGRSLDPQIPAADIVNLHWITDMLDYADNLPRLARRTPLVWTFHDMNAFTGGCHYTGDCARFTAACGCCPLLAKSGPHDRSARIFARKQAALRRIPTGRLHLVSPSRWLSDEAERSTLFGRFDSSVIPNGLDAAEFAPMDQAEARQKLRLRPDGRILLFVTEKLNNPRKGARLMLEGIERISHLPNLQICVIGEPDPGADMPSPLFHLLGLISDNCTLAAAYSAADVFVIPSRQDNLPNTVLESMACGTPVVGFDTGGIPDMIEPGENGYLAPVGDSEALAEQLRRILEDDEGRHAMGERARQTILSRYTLSHQAAAYLDLYRTLLERDRSASRLTKL